MYRKGNSFPAINRTASFLDYRGSIVCISTSRDIILEAALQMGTICKGKLALLKCRKIESESIVTSLFHDAIITLRFHQDVKMANRIWCMGKETSFASPHKKFTRS